MASRGARALAVLVALLLAAPGLAGAPSARDHFFQGKEAYDLGRFAEALASYEEAYRLDPRPATLFNIAQCHRHLGDYEKAAFSYRRFLDLGQPDEKTRALTRELLVEVEAKAAAAQQASDAPLALSPFPEARLADAGAPPLLDASAQPPRKPLTRQWWFWAGAGTVVAGVAAGTAVALTRPGRPSPTLGEANLR